MATMARVALVCPHGAVLPQLAAPEAWLGGVDARVVGELDAVAAAARAPRRAHTAEVAGAVPAGAAEGAGRRRALVDVDAAVGAGEARGALAHARIDAVEAAAAVVARVRGALVDVALARGAVPAVLAQAREAVARVDARGAVLARGQVAGAALGCGKRAAVSPIAWEQAGGRKTLGNTQKEQRTQRLTNLARGALPALGAAAHEGRAQVGAHPAVLARGRVAVGRGGRARAPLPSLRARAREVHPAVDARGVVPARLVGALVRVWGRRQAQFRAR